MDNYRVVVCGFEKYEGVEVNPSRLVAQSLADEGIVLDNANVSVTSVLLPMSFQHAWPTLEQTLETVEPHIVLATGLKTHLRTIALERCARNVIDAHKPDADNVQPRREVVIDGAPQAYWTGVPLRAIASKFAKHNIPVTLSSDAGTFVCNSLFFELLDWCAHHANTTAGFISLPHVDKPSGYTKGMKLDVMIDAARDVVTTTIEARRADSHYQLLAA